MPPDVPAPEPHSTAVEKPRGNIGITLGGYEIEGELGRGGMGVVYRARQAKLNRTVALKMLTGHYGQDELKRFHAEAETVAGLHHTNIVHIYEVGENDGVPFFSMEFVEGGTLADRLRKEGPPPVREAAALMMSVARALHFAHQNGVVHRDMKPGNVLIDSDGVPKVADFGIAKRLAEEGGLTSSGAVIGTPAYMAPEQARGASRHVGPAADVYALGAMLYEMLTGRPPFLPEDSETAFTDRVLNEDPVSPAYHRPQIPRDIETICMKCLEKEPRDRYNSAAVLAEDLRRFLADEPILARPPTRLVTTMRWVRRHPWKFVARAALVLVAVAVAVRAGRWELYERAHLEYSAFLDFRNGGLEPVGLLRSEQVRRISACYRLTRSGRLGPITKIEVVNSKGKPAIDSQNQQLDLLPSYLKGVMGVEYENSKGRQSVSLDIAHERGEAVELACRDRNGRVTVRIHYERAPEADAGDRVFRASFKNAQGHNYTMPSGASYADIRRDQAGRDVSVSFFTGSQIPKPARNGEGVFGYRIEYDRSGRPEWIINTSESGQPMPNNRGITQIRLHWDVRDHPMRLSWHDGNRNPVSWNGVAAIACEYDSAGNIRQYRKLNTKDELADGPDGDTNDFGSWAIKDCEYDAAGQNTRFSLRTANPKALPPKVERVEFGYDGNGYPSEQRNYGPGGFKDRHVVWRRDERGNVVEEKELNPKGKIISWNRFEYDRMGNCTVTEELDEDGKVTQRTLRTFAGEHPVSERYEDGNRKPRTVGNGYTQIESRYTDNGYLKEKVYSGYHDPNTPAVAVHEMYDERGRLQQEVWRDSAQKAVKGVKGWAWRKLTYRENSTAILTEAYEDGDGQPARHPDGYSTLRNEYDENGLLATKVTDGYDGSEGYSRKQERFDTRGYAVGESYFDKAGAKAWCKDGYHRAEVQAFTELGMPGEIICEEYDPARYQCFRRRASETWSGRRMTRMVWSYEDRDGRPALGPERCSGVEYDYDEQGRVIAEVQTGCSPDAWGSFICRTETEWAENGKMRRQIVQALDAGRRLVAVFTASHAASRTENAYSVNGKILHTVSNGFAEEITGFSSLEAHFDPDGKLESIAYRRSDGATVEVQAVITFISPTAQEKAAELRAGDVLLTANGAPVKNSYAFLSGDQFPGGYLEIERAGAPMKIAGFKPGKIGVYLKDKAKAR